MDDNDSTSPPPSSSSKVLLLGISYPDVKGHMEKHGYSEDILIHKRESIEQAVELVRRGILTEMDARDYARCIATEKVGNLEAYTVSKEVGGVYRSDRHVYANFNNSRGLYNALLRNLGNNRSDNLQFQQVILDYYWMPTGWLVTRWAKSLFQNTLPDLVKYQLLAHPDNPNNKSSTQHEQQQTTTNNNDEKENNPDSSNNDNVPNDNDITEKDNDKMETDNETTNDASTKNSIELEQGVVFLPFCAHVCKELVGAIGILRRYYAITFVHKKELSGHALWKGTMEIDPNIMQHRLGKRLDQEEIYCTFQPKDIYGSMEDSHINKDDVMKMLLSIENFDNIRMIRLRPLKQHNPIYNVGHKNKCSTPEQGGFIGLNWSMGRQRFKEFRSRRKPPKLRLQQPKQPITEQDKPDFDDTESVSTISSSSSSEEEEEEEYSWDSDYDPYDPKRVSETTYFYPYPTLDLESYINGKEIVDDDYIMDSWAETWGPKASRKKNRKQGILQNSYNRIRRKQKGFLSSNPRLADPDNEEEEGYKWTLTDDEGWILSLSGDAPEAEYESKIVQKGKKDYEMTASRHLFEMKNPGYKALKRSFGDRSFMSCYQIPKRSVLFKMQAAMDAQKAIAEAEREATLTAGEALVDLFDSLRDQEEKERNTQNSLDVTPIDEISISKVKELSSKSLRVHLEAYKQSTIPRRREERQKLLENLISEHKEQRAVETDVQLLLSQGLANEGQEYQDAHLLNQLVDLSLSGQVLSQESRRILENSQGMTEVTIEPVLPPFKPRLRYLYYDLSGGDNFPQELHRLLRDAETNVVAHIISWQEKGKSFKVHDPDNFESRILSQCCLEVHDSTFGNFVNNLSSFGFTKIKEGKRKGGYNHELFRRGKPSEVPLIERVELEENEEEDSNDDEPGDARELLEDGHTLESAPSQPGSSASSRNGMKCSLPSKARRKTPPLKQIKYNLASRDSFLEELHRLLEEGSSTGLEKCIRWYPEGKSFGISDERAFTNEVLRRHSNCTKISSFEAILFKFNFNKTRKSGNDRRYEHPDFNRGRPGQLSRIEVRSKSKLPSAVVAKDQEHTSSKKRKIPETPESHVATLTSSNNSARREYVAGVASQEDFISSLRAMLTSEIDDSALKWLDDGNAFIIKNEELFESSLASRYFGVNISFSCFRRQLRHFGFDTAGIHGKEKLIWSHPLFQRDYPDFWRLSHNKVLCNKIIACVASEMKGETVSEGGISGPPGVVKEDFKWEDYPFLQNVLFNSKSLFYSNLILSMKTKKLQEIHSALVKSLRDVVKGHEFVFDAGMDDKMLCTRIRSFFVSRLNIAKTKFNALKSPGSSANDKSMLQARINQADSTVFEDSFGTVSLCVEERENSKVKGGTASAISMGKESYRSSSLGSVVTKDSNICESQKQKAETSRATHVTITAPTSPSPLSLASVSIVQAAEERNERKLSVEKCGAIAGKMAGKRKSSPSATAQSRRKAKRRSAQRQEPEAKASVVSPTESPYHVQNEKLMARNSRIASNDKDIKMNAHESLNGARSWHHSFFMQVPQDFSTLRDTQQSASNRSSLSPSQFTAQSMLSEQSRMFVLERFPVSPLNSYLSSEMSNWEPTFREELTTCIPEITRVLTRLGITLDDILLLFSSSSQTCASQRVKLFCEISLWYGGIPVPNEEEINAMDRTIPGKPQPNSHCSELVQRIRRLEAYTTLLRRTEGLCWFRRPNLADLIYKRLTECFDSQEFQLLCDRYLSASTSQQQQQQQQRSNSPGRLLITSNSPERYTQLPPVHMHQGPDLNIPSPHRQQGIQNHNTNEYSPPSYSYEGMSDMLRSLTMLMPSSSPTIANTTRSVNRTTF